MTEGEYTYTPTGKPIRKFVYEEQIRSYDFSRWIGDGESLQNPTVLCLDQDDVDVSSTHVGTPAVVGSAVQWWLKGGQASGVYYLKIRAETNLGQKLEGRVIYYNGS